LWRFDNQRATPQFGFYVAIRASMVQRRLSGSEREDCQRATRDGGLSVAEYSG
jgi:hypothetical protein